MGRRGMREVKDVKDIGALLIRHSQSNTQVARFNAGLLTSKIVRFISQRNR